jgi:phage terminase large subunit GpA-like protein
MDGGSAYAVGWSEGWALDLELMLDEWSDRYVELTGESAAEPGRWRTDRTPYLRGIMRALSPSDPTKRIVFKKASQVGGSQFGINWLGYIVHITPGPTMGVLPTVDLAERFSKQRLEPIVAHCEPVRERIAPAKSRDSGNTILVKQFPGGLLIITGANSAAALRSMPARFLFCDEIDAYPEDVEGEGDPVALAEKRTQTFRRRKILLVSTPTEAETSRIEREWKKSDQRRYFVPCPHCGHMQWLRWRDDNGAYRLIFDPKDPRVVEYQCESCNVLIEEHHKTEMLARGEWRPTAKGDGITAGFHISALYSPLGWKSWAEIVKEFLEAKSSPEQLKTWVNTVLGEAWESAYSKKLDRETLAGRCLMYAEGTAPAGALVAVAGVDVQDNRLAGVIRAYGRNEESWLVRHFEIYGDPLAPRVWEELDEMLLAPIPLEGGGELRVRVACVDSGDGDKTQAVYNFTRARRARLVFAIKGSSNFNAPSLGKPSPQDINYKGKKVAKGVELYPVGPSAIKGILFGRIVNADPEANKAQFHFHDGTGDQYFEELTSETQAIKFRNGHPVRFWKKKDNDRNEALDAEVYAYAALLIFFRHYKPPQIFDRIEAAIEASKRAGGDPDRDSSSSAEEPPAAPPRPAKKPFVAVPRRGKPFATGF